MQAELGGKGFLVDWNNDQKRLFPYVYTMSRCGYKSCNLLELICQEFLPTLIREYLGLVKINIGFHVLNSFTATLGNLMVLVTIWRTRSLHAPPNVLIFGLALADFCVGSIAQPIFIKVQVQVYNDLEIATCTLNMASVFLNILLGIVALLAITVITVDRYLAIHLHLRYEEIVKDTRIYVCIFAIWIVGVVISAMLFLSLKILQWTLIITGTVCILTELCVRIYIYLVVRHHQAQIQLQVQIAQAHQFNMLRFKKSADRCLLLACLYFLCYLPQITFLVRLSFYEGESSSYVGFYFSYTFVVLNASLNPPISFWHNRDIRTATKQILMKLSCHVQVQ